MTVGLDWAELTFGKQAGKTLPMVLFADPDWFFWAVEACIFANSPLLSESRAIYQRATAILIPARHGGASVEYAIEHDTGAFGGMGLVPAGFVSECRSSSFVSSVIDMSVPRRLRPYDKGGMRIFLRDMKQILFGDSDLRMTKRRAEAFMGHDANFALANQPNSVMRGAAYG